MAMPEVAVVVAIVLCSWVALVALREVVRGVMPYQVRFAASLFALLVVKSIREVLPTPVRYLAWVGVVGGIIWGVLHGGVDNVVVVLLVVLACLALLESRPWNRVAPSKRGGL